jgi:hypothetical protein
MRAGEAQVFRAALKSAELCRSSLMAEMKATDFRELDHPAMLRRLHGARIRRIFVQCQMRPGSMMAGQQAADNSSQMSFAEHDDVIETPRSQGPDYSLRAWVLPGTAACSENFVHVEAFTWFLHVSP